jgi:AraC family transcriptional regulator, L-rhamnose operon transcriptional activator RhaR
MSGAPRIPRSRVLSARGRVAAAERLVVDGDLDRHGHEFLEIVVVLGGRGEHVSLRGTEPVARGDAFVIPPDGWHAYRDCHALQAGNLYVASWALQRELAWIRTDPMLGWLLAPGEGRAVLDANATARVARALAALEAAGDDRRADQVARALLVLAELGDAAAAARPLPDRRAAPDGAVAELAERIAAEPDRRWTLDELARMASYERSYLVRRFREHTGLPPLAYVARVRVDRAAALLLRSDESVARIGAAVGWADPNAFARRFRDHMGLSPSAYRRRRRERT